MLGRCAHRFSVCAKGMGQWLPSWKRRGWRTADNKPVRNADLWQQLDGLVALHEVEWRWVRGHAGDPGNERADALANKGVQVALKRAEINL